MNHPDLKKINYEYIILVLILVGLILYLSHR